MLPRGKFSCTMLSQLHSIQGFEWFVDLFHFPFMQLLGLPCFNSVALGPPGQKVLALNLVSISTRPRVGKPPRELGRMDLSDFKAKDRTKKKVLKKGKRPFSVFSHKRFYKKENGLFQFSHTKGSNAAIFREKVLGDGIRCWGRGWEVIWCQHLPVADICLLQIFACCKYLFVANICLLQIFSFCKYLPVANICLLQIFACCKYGYIPNFAIGSFFEEKFLLI